VLRIAAIQLELGNVAGASDLVASYFKRARHSIDTVGADYALLVGYLYAVSGDVDQALAWFSKVRSVTGGSGIIGEAGDRGAKGYLQSIPQSEFAALAYVWNSDAYISSLLSAEKARRSNGGEIRASARFWESPEAMVAEQREDAQPLPPLTSSVATMLPLTGRYGALGLSAKNGIELAFTSTPSTTVTSEDAGETSATSSALFDRYFQQQVSLIIGPLVGEAAEAVAPTADQAGVPLLVLSKSANLAPSESILQLGPTPESQMKSLVEAASDLLGHRRFGVVFADNDEGRSFAQAFRNALQEKGLSLHYEAAYAHPDAETLKRIGIELATAPVDALLFTDSLDVSAKFVQATGAEAIKHLTLLGTGRWDVPEQITRLRRVFKGAVYVSPFFKDSDRQEVRDFVASYVAAYGKPPTFLSAQGYDAAKVAQEAIRIAESEEILLPEALSKVKSINGITGQINVVKGKVDRTFTVVKIGERGLEEVSSSQVPQYSMQGDVRH
jgi:ABC-type branched-subunit amino acid transport system substrate-binding protein